MAVFSKLKQFRDMRSQAKTLQNMLAEETVHVDAKGGKVRMVMDGNQKIVALDVDDSLLTPDKKNDLLDGFKEVHENAVKKVQRVMAEKMRKSGMKVPGLDI